MKIEGEEKLRPEDFMIVRGKLLEPSLFVLRNKGDCVKVRESDFDILEIIKWEGVAKIIERGTRIAPFCSYKKRADYDYKLSSGYSKSTYQLEYNFMPCPLGNLIINRASSFPHASDFPPPQALQVSVDPNQIYTIKKMEQESAMQNYQRYQDSEPYYNNKTCFNLLWNKIDCGNKDAIIACDGDSDSQTIKLGGCDLLVNNKNGERLIQRPPKKPMYTSYCKDLRDQITTHK